MINITTNYNGSLAQGILMEMLANTVMFNPANARQLYTVSNKISLQTLGTTGTISRAYDCNFVGGDVNLVDKELNPVRFTAERDFCKSDLWGSWYAFTYKANLSASETERIDMNNVEAFTQYVLSHLVKKVATEIDQAIWQADTTLVGNPFLSQFNGLIAKMKADATVIDAPYAAITKANVIDKLGDILALVPSQVLDSTNFTIYMNTSDVLNLNLAFGAGATFVNANTQIGSNFLGYRVVGSPFIPKNTIVATHKDNIVIGTNTNGQVSFNVVDMSFTTAEDKIRIKGNYSLDASHIFGSEVVLHTV